MKITGSNVLETMLCCAIANSFTGWTHYGVDPAALWDAIDMTVRQYIGFFLLCYMWWMDNYRLKVEAKS